MAHTNRTRDLFLFCMSIIYLAAFSSLLVQIPGLYGENGILPARTIIEKEAESWEDLLKGQPTLLRLTPKLGLDIQKGMDLLCLAGVIISYLCVVFKPMRDTISFVLLWMFYFSLYQMGHTFLWFQWDILLLEAGFLTILLAPFHLHIPIKMFRMSFYHKHDSVNLWLVRWLLFRLMFSSGVVKLTSKCPVWWNLTALQWHFESQCIPTSLAWYFHHMSPWLLKMGVVATFMIEIPIPFLFFSPVRSLRLFSFWCQVLLQVFIILTGNYNFFNFLTITLCISLLDDQFLGKALTKTPSSFSINKIASVVVYGFLAYQTYKLFGLKVNFDSIESDIKFTEAEFDNFLSVVVPWTIWLGAFSFAYEVIVALIRCFMEIKGSLWKNWAAIQCMVFTVIASSMLAISLVPYSTLHKEGQKIVPDQAKFLHSRLEKFHLTSSYGLFRRMTGVGGRPEVVIEGSNSMSSGWKEYQFFYKPGDIKRRPPIVAPHQPRLDWQMWFAALGNYQHNPWFVNMAFRLLTNEPDVLQLIQFNPFPDKPPTYLRAQLYTYHYANITDSKTQVTAWWKRELVGEYMPILTKDTPTLVEYLKHSRVIEGKKSKKTKGTSFLGMIMQFFRSVLGQPEGFSFVMSIILMALSTNYIVSFLKA